MRVDKDGGVSILDFRLPIEDEEILPQISL